MQCLETFQNAWQQSAEQLGTDSSQMKSDWDLINYSFKMNELQTHTIYF